jgi:CcmD family protein
MADEAGPYVAAAYVVFIALIAVYVAIIATRLMRTTRRLEDLEDDSRL